MKKHDSTPKHGPAVRAGVERRALGTRTGEGAIVARRVRRWLEARGWRVERGHVRHRTGRREASIWTAARSELARAEA